jgi:hypothetical protein
LRFHRIEGGASLLLETEMARLSDDGRAKAFACKAEQAERGCGDGRSE